MALRKASARFILHSVIIHFTDYLDSTYLGVIDYIFPPGRRGEQYRLVDSF